MSQIEVNGIVPDIKNKILGEMYVQEYWYDGTLEEEANVVYLKISDNWFRLYFDHTIIFWRQNEDDFKPFNDSTYKLRNLGVELGINNSTIIDFHMAQGETCSKVSFIFDNKNVSFVCVGDTTSIET
jgi:hypothetical protein